MTSTPWDARDSQGYATYGEHAERSADALDALIRSEQLPYDLDQVEIVLGARETVVDVLRDRVRDHLDFPIHSDHPFAHLSLTLERMQHDPVLELGVAVSQLPRLPLEQRPSPVDVLDPRAATDPNAAAWVDAARELLAADHVLAGAQDQAWRSNDPTGQAARLALAADTAQVLEAVTVLDHRMEEVGLLTGRLQYPAGVPDRGTVRLLASHLDRLGQQHAEHSSTDLTHLAPAIAPEHREPMKMITAAGDLAGAQRQLTRFLAPMTEHTAGKAHMVNRMTAVMANSIGVSQREVIRQLRTRIASTPQLRNQLPRVERLAELQADVRTALIGLHDVQTPPIHQWMRHQQQEISVAVKNGAIQRLTDQQVVDVLAATEGVNGKWARHEPPGHPEPRPAARRARTSTARRASVSPAPVPGRPLRPRALMDDPQDQSSKRLGPASSSTTSAAALTLSVVLKLVTVIQERPPEGYRGDEVLAFDRIVTEADDYQRAKAAALEQMPAGWRVASFRVEDRTAD